MLRVGAIAFCEVGHGFSFFVLDFARGAPATRRALAISR
jgi:hypothetical protein